MKHAALYLLRDWRGATNFFEALARHPLPDDAELVLVVKGAKGRECERRLWLPEHEVIEVGDFGLSLRAFAAATRQLAGRGYDSFTYLNSWSRPLVGHWHEALAGAALRPGVGLAGATGSWERFNSVLWPPGPNPHIRTTAFTMCAELAASLWPRFGWGTKLFEQAVESSRWGLTRRAMARGFAPALVGRIQNYGDPSQWMSSCTFRSGEQENLLVADRQTDDYAAAGHEERLRLSVLAWGGGL